VIALPPTTVPFASQSPTTLSPERSKSPNADAGRFPLAEKVTITRWVGPKEIDYLKGLGLQKSSALTEEGLASLLVGKSECSNFKLLSMVNQLRRQRHKVSRHFVAKREIWQHINHHSQILTNISKTVGLAREVLRDWEKRWHAENRKLGRIVRPGTDPGNRPVTEIPVSHPRQRTTHAQLNHLWAKCSEI
jgi:hypothetical protein